MVAAPVLLPTEVAMVDRGYDGYSNRDLLVRVDTQMQFVHDRLVEIEETQKMLDARIRVLERKGDQQTGFFDASKAVITMVATMAGAIGGWLAGGGRP